MIARKTYDDVAWIDLSAPTEEEVRSVMNEFNIDAAVENYLLSKTRHSEVNLRENAILLVLFFPTFHDDTEDDRKEIDFIIGKNFLITAHQKEMESITNFGSQLNPDGTTDKEHAYVHGGYLFYHIIRNFYRTLCNRLEEIDDRLEDAEDKVFQGGEKKMVTVLSQINKDLLDAKQATRSHERVLESLGIAGKQFFGEGFSYHLHSITSEFNRAWSMLEAYKETLEELRQTNDALLAAGTTRVMKTLTIITFATSPAVIITGLFGMNSMHDPILGSANDFWIILLIILLLTTSILGFFVYKRWL